MFVLYLYLGEAAFHSCIIKCLSLSYNMKILSGKTICKSKQAPGSACINWIAISTPRHFFKVTHQNSSRPSWILHVSVNYKHAPQLRLPGVCIIDPGFTLKLQWPVLYIEILPHEDLFIRLTHVIKIASSINRFHEWIRLFKRPEILQPSSYPSPLSSWFCP